MASGVEDPSSTTTTTTSDNSSTTLAMGGTDDGAAPASGPASPPATIPHAPAAFGSPSAAAQPPPGAAASPSGANVRSSPSSSATAAAATIAKLSIGPTPLMLPATAARGNIPESPGPVFGVAPSPGVPAFAPPFGAKFTDRGGSNQIHCVACCWATSSACQLELTGVVGMRTKSVTRIEAHLVGGVADGENDPVTRLAKTASRSFASLYPPSPDANTLEPGSPEYLNLFVQETTFYNHLILSFLPSSFVSALPHFLQTWLRNYVAGCLLYLIGSGLWSIVVYSLFGWYLYSGPDDIPSLKAMWRQISVSMRAMPLYTLLPTISERLVETGWTRCYSQIRETAAPRYMLGLLLYMLIVEFGIYWAHRLLHDIKPLYTHLHAIHHIYNKQNTLSPFAGLAFHPLDGIIQALPHVLSLFLIPTHFTTHLLLLFAEGIWTTNIHDNLHGNVLFIMGAKYHTIHHTTYRHNYGHYTVLFDWLFGTLHSPEHNSGGLSCNSMGGTTHGMDGITHGMDGITHGMDGITHGMDGITHGMDGGMDGITHTKDALLSGAQEDEDTAL
ncbi:unnamed protein product [Closterium sp. Yama58-4]|nr:unnamed protein product [Closterium sp. Yama58-4]